MHSSDLHLRNDSDTMIDTRNNASMKSDSASIQPNSVENTDVVLLLLCKRKKSSYSTCRNRRKSKDTLMSTADMHLELATTTSTKTW